MIIPNCTQHDSPHISKINTGLGNALFQIFTGYGISKDFNRELNLIDFNKLLQKLETFNLNHKNTIYRNFLNFIKPINNINLHILKETPNFYSCYDNNIINNVKNKKSNKIFLVGYLQSHLYFDNYYSEIIELLKPDKISYNVLLNKYPNLFDKNIINISIHFRFNWGCNITYDNNFNYTNDAIEYLLKDINEYSNIKFNFFSDNINFLKNNIKIKKKFKNIKIIFYEDNYDYIDLWAMSLCKYNILSNSTLSWWGAYINTNIDKKVLYPLDVLRLVGGTLYNEIKIEERIYQHYKKEWIGIDTKNVLKQ